MIPRAVTLRLPMPPSTNNLYVNGRKGRFPSQKYETWKMEAWTEMLSQRPSKVAGPVSLTYVFQDRADNRRRDLDNLIKAPTDFLVAQGIIEADDSRIVRRISLAWGQVEGLCVTIAPHEAQSSNRVPETQPTERNHERARAQ